MNRDAFCRHRWDPDCTVHSQALHWRRIALWFSTGTRSIYRGVLGVETMLQVKDRSRFVGVATARATWRTVGRVVVGTRSSICLTTKNILLELPGLFHTYMARVRSEAENLCRSALSMWNSQVISDAAVHCHL